MQHVPTIETIHFSGISYLVIVALAEKQKQIKC